MKIEIKLMRMPGYGLQLAEQLGTQAAGGIVGDVLGLFTQNQQNENQINQQQKLTDMQVKAQEQLGDYNYTNQMKLYNATGPETQVNNLKKAGLNPALMYGSGAGGGGATAAAQAGNANTGTAQGSTAAMGMERGMNIDPITTAQLKVMNAQADSLEADAKLKGANTPDNGTNLGNLQGAHITQGISNLKTQQALMEAQTAATNINAENVQTQTKEIEDKIGILDNDLSISRATLNDKISLIKQAAVNSILTGQATKAGIQVDYAQIHKMSQDIAQGWKALDIQKFKANVDASFPGIGEISGNLIEQIFNAIDTATGRKNDQQPIKIK